MGARNNAKTVAFTGLRQLDASQPYGQ